MECRLQWHAVRAAAAAAASAVLGGQCDQLRVERDPGGSVKEYAVMS